MQKWGLAVPEIDGHVPDAGDVYWIDYGGPMGHEQGGRRPSLVLSPRAYNARSSILVTCPISRTDRRWPFQVAISPVDRIKGFALVDQLRALDPLARHVRLAGAVSDETLRRVRLVLASLLGLGS